jgi:hypothetical protein
MTVKFVPDHLILKSNPNQTKPACLLPAACACLPLLACQTRGQ